MKEKYISDLSIKDWIHTPNKKKLNPLPSFGKPPLRLLPLIGNRLIWRIGKRENV
jgi:hypothetical protein